MKLLKKLENIFAAVAFAEAGEHETAVRMVKEADENDAVECKGRRVEECREASATAK